VSSPLLPTTVVGGQHFSIETGGIRAVRDSYSCDQLFRVFFPLRSPFDFSIDCERLGMMSFYLLPYAGFNRFFWIFWPGALSLACGGFFLGVVWGGGGAGFGVCWGCGVGGAVCGVFFGWGFCFVWGVVWGDSGSFPSGRPNWRDLIWDGSHFFFSTDLTPMMVSSLNFPVRCPDIPIFSTAVTKFPSSRRVAQYSIDHPCSGLVESFSVLFQFPFSPKTMATFRVFFFSWTICRQPFFAHLKPFDIRYSAAVDPRTKNNVRPRADSPVIVYQTGTI